METSCNPEDPAEFESSGEKNPELASKFFDCYSSVFAAGELTRRFSAMQYSKPSHR